jgi:hypothetical protein
MQLWRQRSQQLGYHRLGIGDSASSDAERVLQIMVLFLECISSVGERLSLSLKDECLGKRNGGWGKVYSQKSEHFRCFENISPLHTDCTHVSPLRSEECTCIQDGVMHTVALTPAHRTVPLPTPLRQVPAAGAAVLKPPRYRWDLRPRSAGCAKCDGWVHAGSGAALVEEGEGRRDDALRHREGGG